MTRAARARARAALLVVAVGALTVPGCGRTTGSGAVATASCDGDATCACPTPRARASGVCCPPYTVANGEACVARDFARAAWFHDIGPAGAQSVAVAVDDTRRVVLAWTTTDGLRTKLAVAEERGDAFVAREPASSLPGSSTTPAITAGPGARATVAWKEELDSNGSGVFVSERDEAGTWTDPHAMSDAYSFAPRAFEPFLTTTPLGEVILLWNQWLERSPGIYGLEVATRKAGAEWVRPANPDAILSPDAFFVNAPKAASSPRGDVLVTWYQAKAGDHLMAWYSERRGESGAFSRALADETLSPPGADVGGQGGGSPKPAVGPRGEGACAWLQKNADGHTRPFLATREPAAAWQKPASLTDSLGASGDATDASAIQVTIGSAGALVVAWTEAAPGGGVVRALRRDHGGAFVDDVHAPPALSSPGTSVQGLTLRATREGAMILAWLEVGTGGSALRLRRAWDDPARGVEWGPIETLAMPDKLADSPAIAAGGTPERIVLAWTEGRVPRVQIATLD